MKFNDARDLLLEEGYRFKTSVVSVDVGNPLARELVVIKIEHGRYRVNAYSVYMILVYPIKRVGYKE